MNVKTYLGDLLGGSLWISESRILAKPLLDNLSDQQWKQLIVEENILQKKSPNSANRNARTIRLRLEPLGDNFLKQLSNASEKEAIQLLMVALLIHSPIVVSFINQSIIEAKKTYKKEITKDAWATFLNDQIRIIPELENYSQASLDKMGSNAIKSLVDCGYLNTSRKRELQIVYLFPEVKNTLVDLKREDLIPSMECTL
jgi:hypothetical protein